MSLVKRKQISIELANDNYKLALHELFGMPLKKDISLLSLLNQQMILKALDEDDGTVLTAEDRKCLIARLGLSNDWKSEILQDCTLPTVVTTRVQRTNPFVVGQIAVVSDCTLDGGCNVTEKGICYSTTDSTPTIANSSIENSIGGTGVYSLNAPISLSGTNYYRSYAINSKGIVYGNILSITIET